MKLNFEKWLDNSLLSGNSRSLFDSAVVCYKSNVPSAALLMSYLGFMLILKERVMKAKKPVIFPDGIWNGIIENLKNDEKWENEVLNVVRQKDKLDKKGDVYQSAVFIINDNLRSQIEHWKDRRNDCAHNKDNIIISSHVETFWSTLR